MPNIKLLSQQGKITQKQISKCLGPVQFCLTRYFVPLIFYVIGERKAWWTAVPSVTSGKQVSNNCAPCFNKIYFVFLFLLKKDFLDNTHYNTTQWCFARDLRHHALPIIRKQPKYLIIHAGTNYAVKFTSRDILYKLLKLKSFIQEKLPHAEIIILHQHWDQTTVKQRWR